MARKVLILGATSAIAIAVIKQLAANGDELFLMARNAEHLQRIVQDLQARYKRSFGYLCQDLSDVSLQNNAFLQAKTALGGLDVVMIAYATFPDQAACQASTDLSLQELHINAMSVIAWLTMLANYFEQQKHGTIAVIGSVAGDRGRQSNYVYGTAKAALSTFMQGLRNRLSKVGVHVLTIKPGFVDTPMTKAFKKGLLWAKPEQVAQDIVKAINKKRDVIYTPGFWRLIMLIIKSIPERIFKRLSL